MEKYCWVDEFVFRDDSEPPDPDGKVGIAVDEPEGEMFAELKPAPVEGEVFEALWLPFNEVEFGAELGLVFPAPPSPPFPLLILLLTVGLEEVELLPDLKLLVIPILALDISD